MAGAQGKNFYPSKDLDWGKKYYVAVHYGTGTSRWRSSFKDTEFYDKDGKVINTGDLRFTAKSPTRHYDVNVLAPVKNIYLGMGIAFEFDYLAELKVFLKDGYEFMLFEEGMRFDKIYFQMEKPFKNEKKRPYNISLAFKAGWYGYTNVKRFNFLGEKPIPLSFLVGTGATFDYEVYRKVFVYAQPYFEYKIYDNFNNEAEVHIVHNVFGLCLNTGLRVDLGKLTD